MKTSREEKFVNFGVNETDQNERKNVLNETGENGEPEDQNTSRSLFIFLSIPNSVVRCQLRGPVSPVLNINLSSEFAVSGIYIKPQHKTEWTPFVPRTLRTRLSSLH